MATTESSSNPSSPEDPESRWPAVAAVLAVGSIATTLPPRLTIGPKWLLLALVCLLIFPTMIAHRLNRHRLNVLLGHLLAATLTAFLLGSVSLLVVLVLDRKEPPTQLLRAGSTLWFSNVLVFAYWYWRLDAGGPYRRELKAGHSEGAFLFPQMTLPEDWPGEHGQAWSPRFIDYLFLAFNTSSAFSPTDVPVLSRWAKVMCMVQSIISLTIVAILVGRGVNIL